MTPRAGVKRRQQLKRAFWGPFFFDPATRFQNPGSALVYPAGDGDTCLPKHMRHLRFAQA
jgi:hypothetical protein